LRPGCDGSAARRSHGPGAAGRHLIAGYTWARPAARALDRLGGSHEGPDPRPQERHRVIASDDDTRVIEPDAEAYNATLTRRVDLTDDLAYFWVKFDGEATPFESGQYMTTGVLTDGKMLQRPYSVASPPSVANSEGYEFFVRLVPILRFTQALWRLPIGHRMRMIGPKGKFMLEPDDDRAHLYISTGTGIAPFISMVRETMVHGAPRRTVLINGCSYADELGYVPELETWQADPAYRLTYVPTISRAADPRNAGWGGKVGRAEQVVEEVCREQGLDPQQTVVYICGNPEMILNAEQLLIDRGFPEFHVKKELYWPKGKSPTGVASPAG
jgi:ferredoxin/flavodoxin---NADP+ reductase